MAVLWQSADAAGSAASLYKVENLCNSCDLIYPRLRTPAKNELTLSVLKQVQIKRVVVISAVDEAHCRHTITGEVKVRVVGVGKLVEKYVMQNTISALELLDSVVARCAEYPGKHAWHCKACWGHWWR